MDLMVRKYLEEDYDEVNKLLYKTFGYEVDKQKDEKAHEFVGIYDSKVVGYFILNEMTDIVRNLKIYHLDYVCVDEDYRGRGFAKVMMEYAIKYAHDTGACRIDLTSGNKRIAAHKLYLGLGFEKRDTSVFRKETL